MSYLILILAVFLGVFVAGYFAKDKKWIQLFLSFSGAYLLSITVLHLLPEVYEDSQKNIGLFILLGIVIQTILEFFSRGAEHGHVHTHSHNKDVTWMLFISLSVHAFLEGMPLGFENHGQLLWAIVIHTVPVAIILFIFLKNTSMSKMSIYLFISFFALMSPLGSFLVGKMSVMEVYHKEITAVIIGVFLHISTAILFESSDNHHFNLRKFIAIMLGFFVAFFGAYLM